MLDIADANLGAARGVAIREFPLTTGYGFADDVLFVDGQAAGVIGANKAETTLTGVELQAARYSDGFPNAFPAHLRPLPVLIWHHETAQRKKPPHPLPGLVPAKMLRRIWFR